MLTWPSDHTTIGPCLSTAVRYGRDRCKIIKVVDMVTGPFESGDGRPVWTFRAFIGETGAPVFLSDFTLIRIRREGSSTGRLLVLFRVGLLCWSIIILMSIGKSVTPAYVPSVTDDSSSW